MTIGDLKRKIQDLPDDMQVLFPANATIPFDGYMFSPCVEESGVSKAPVGTMEEIERAENLGTPIEEVDEFLLVPCGYFEREHSEQETLN